MSPLPVIETKALGKRYGSLWALRDCSLEVPAGSVVALVGPNGAGKTTLLHMLIGLVKPSAGEACVLGWSPREQPQLVLPRVGFVAQDHPLYRGFRLAEMLISVSVRCWRQVSQITTPAPVDRARAAAASGTQRRPQPHHDLMVSSGGASPGNCRATEEPATREALPRHGTARGIDGLPVNPLTARRAGGLPCPPARRRTDRLSASNQGLPG